MRGWKGAIGVLLVMMLGFVSGVASTILWIRYARSPDRIAATITRQLTRELDLNSRQQDVLRDAVTGARQDLLVLRQEVRPRVEEILKKSRKRLESSLTEEQKQRLDRYIKERERARRRFLQN
ncbi:MAG: hypothetical protein HYX75_04030 [Acidobacteria bacterium]|nr:hypothetical protein [Acidobacteriota bacterium]